MRKNMYRFVYASIYIVVALVAIIISCGLFSLSTRKDFYLFYSSVSNYLCIGYVVVEFLYNLIIAIKNKTINYITIAPRIKFILAIDVLLNCVVANTILASQYGYIWSLVYWRELVNPFYNLFLPILFVCEYVFLSDHRIKSFTPLGAIVFPTLYVVLIYTRANLLPSGYQGIIYPYSFLNPSIGIIRVFAYVFTMIMGMIVVGYGYKILDSKIN